LADLQRTVYLHSGHPSPAGRAQDRVSSPAKDRRSANCATQHSDLRQLEDVDVISMMLVSCSVRRKLASLQHEYSVVHQITSTDVWCRNCAQQWTRVFHKEYIVQQTCCGLR